MGVYTKGSNYMSNNIIYNNAGKEKYVSKELSVAHN
jgi:hypothetical protein